MENKNYLPLTEHFIFETFECESTHWFSEQLKNYYQQNGFDIKDYRYANAFYEKQTEHVFYFDLSHTKDFKTKGFEFYLNRLPSLKLSDVTYLFALFTDKDNFREDAFKFATDYPSSFCKSLLGNTYGNVIYTYQLMELIDACLTIEQKNTVSLNEYKRLYNCRAASVFTEIENMILPDGYSLSNLLKKFSLLHNQGNDYGFVNRPNHCMAWQFIEKAKKYTLKN